MSMLLKKIKLMKMKRRNKNLTTNNHALHAPSVLFVIFFTTLSKYTPIENPPSHFIPCLSFLLYEKRNRVS